MTQYKWLLEYRDEPQASHHTMRTGRFTGRVFVVESDMNIQREGFRYAGYVSENFDSIEAAEQNIAGAMDRLTDERKVEILRLNSNRHLWSIAPPQHMGNGYTRMYLVLQSCCKCERVILPKLDGVFQHGGSFSRQKQMEIAGLVEFGGLFEGRVYCEECLQAEQERRKANERWMCGNCTEWCTLDEIEYFPKRSYYCGDGSDDDLPSTHVFVLCKHCYENISAKYWDEAKKEVDRRFKKGIKSS